MPPPPFLCCVCVYCHVWQETGLWRCSFGLIPNDFGQSRSPLPLRSRCLGLFFAEYFIMVVTQGNKHQWAASVWVCLSIGPVPWSWFCFPFLIVSVGGKPGGSCVCMCVDALLMYFLNLQDCFFFQGSGENYCGIALKNRYKWNMIIFCFFFWGADLGFIFTHECKTIWNRGYSYSKYWDMLLCLIAFPTARHSQQSFPYLWSLSFRCLHLKCQFETPLHTNMAKKSASSSRNLIMKTVLLVYIILMTSQQEEDGCNSV